MKMSGQQKFGPQNILDPIFFRFNINFHLPLISPPHPSPPDKLRKKYNAELKSYGEYWSNLIMIFISS